MSAEERTAAAVVLKRIVEAIWEGLPPEERERVKRAAAARLDRSGRAVALDVGRKTKRPRREPIVAG